MHYDCPFELWMASLDWVTLVGEGEPCFPDPLTLTSPHPFCDARSAEETTVNGRGEGTELQSGERSLSTSHNATSVDDETRLGNLGTRINLS